MEKLKDNVYGKALSGLATFLVLASGSYGAQSNMYKNKQ